MALIDLPVIIASSGVELHQRGNKFVGCCPFHAEKTPSFYVFADGKCHCFGCGFHGDAIDFVRRLYGLSYPEAKRHLGIDHSSPTHEEKKAIRERKKNKELVDRFRLWEMLRIGWLGSFINATLQIIASIQTDDDLDECGDLFHLLGKWEYQLDLLLNGDDKSKFLFFREYENV